MNNTVAIDKHKVLLRTLHFESLFGELIVIG